MNQIEISAKNLEDATRKAEAELGVSRGSLQIKVLEESKGFLGLFGKSVRIQATKKGGAMGKAREPREQQAPREKREPRNEPRREKEPTKRAERAPRAAASVEPNPELEEELRVFCEEICALMGATDAKIETKRVGDRVVFNIRSEDHTLFNNKNIRLFEALEHLLRRKPKGVQDDLPFRIFVDFNGVREAREVELISIAKDLSTQVFESKKPVVLNYKSSYDRKIVHMTLSEDKRVFTKSIGNGTSRKLMILPSER